MELLEIELSAILLCVIELLVIHNTWTHLTVYKRMSNFKSNN